MMTETLPSCLAAATVLSHWACQSAGAEGAVLAAGLALAATDAAAPGLLATEAAGAEAAALGLVAAEAAAGAEAGALEGDAAWLPQAVSSARLSATLAGKLVLEFGICFTAGDCKPGWLCYAAEPCRRPFAARDPRPRFAPGNRTWTQRWAFGTTGTQPSLGQSLRKVSAVASSCWASQSCSSARAEAYTPCRTAAPIAGRHFPYGRNATRETPSPAGITASPMTCGMAGWWRSSPIPSQRSSAS